MPKAKDDLTELTEAIAELVKITMNSDEKPGVLVMFTLAPEYKKRYWVSNMDRASRISLMHELLERTIAEAN